MLTNFLHRIVSLPCVYDAVQKLAGRDRISPWLATYLAESSEKVVLDVGGGTGELARILPSSAKYVWLDNDVHKLNGLRRKIKHPLAILGDAGHVSLKNRSIDVVLFIAVAHHLTDNQLDEAFLELARVCRLRLVFLDPIRHPGAMSRLMWKYDRGSYPRTVEELRSHVERQFVIEKESQNSVYHHYWLCAARPRARP
jgi:ubiquinone/menaquinone biosynthesis C-methylase UbiE